MLSAVVFYSFLFLAVVLVPAALILLVLLLLDHQHRLWKRLAVVIGPVASRMVRGLGDAGLRRRYPRATAFLARRFDSGNPWGLAATVAGLGIALGLWFFLGVLQDIVAGDPLTVLNIRLHNAVPLFRTPGMTWFMSAMTQLGGAVVLSLLCVGAVLLALARERARLAATFVLALSASSLVSASLKALFGIARPLDAIVSVQQASFPSGHMLSGTVIYGLLAALLLGSRASRGMRALGTTLLLLVIVGIGLSRLYLGVHWPSDLLGSLALALIVLACLLFFLHYDRPLPWIDTIKMPLGAGALRIAGGAVLLVALAAAGVLASGTKMLPIGPPTPARAITLQALRAALPADVPRQSEDLVGGQMEPISLVFAGSEADLAAAFAAAGWTRADLPTPSRVVQEMLAALAGRADPAAPATPAFFADQPQTLTFEKPDGNAPSIRRRHHTRVWQTAYCLAPDCRAVWVATASFDIGVGLSSRLYLPTHRIDPAVDVERQLIVNDLVGVGAKAEGNFMVSATRKGTNAAGDPFSTDGRAELLILP